MKTITNVTVCYTARLKCQHVRGFKIGGIFERNLQDLLTMAVAKQGWWMNSRETFKDGSRAPTWQMTFKATLLCSATSSNLRSSANLSGSLEKLLLISLAIF